MANNRRPITDDEIEPELRTFFNLDNQRSVDGRLHTLRTCLRCGEERWLHNGNIRKYAHLGKLTGMCVGCAATTRVWTGPRKSVAGYIYIYQPDHPKATEKSYVLEHRLVMEKAIGRFLKASETVHHKNGIKRDNRLENLELWNGTHPTGVRPEDYHCVGCRCFE